MKMKKFQISILITLSLLMVMSFTTIASAGGLTEDIANASSNDTENLVGQADVFAKEIVTTIRVLAVLALVVMIMICGGRLMFGGEKGITTVKVLIIPIIISAFLVFKTEAVVATILNLVGYTA